MPVTKRIEEIIEIFKSPPMKYRAIPFWAWNCKLEKGKLMDQIPVFKEMGFGGFHMHVRTGLDTEYLGKEFMGYVRNAVEEAEKLGLCAWIYDEDRWASGTAGGMGTKEKKFRQKYLLFTPYSYEEKGPSKPERGFLAPLGRACNGFLLGRYDVCLDNSGFLDSYKLLHDGENAEFEEWFAYMETARDNPWYNNQAYMDTLQRGATENFLAITHEAYAQKVGDKFGKTVPGIFTDEPQFAKKHTLPFPESKTDVILPWTEDLEESFMENYGYSLLSHLPELFWETKDHLPSKARYHFHDHVTERFCKGFFVPYAKWCHEHGLKFTGHLMEEPTLASQCAAVGEAMRAYVYFDIPGVDMLKKDMEFTTVIQACSVSRQYGKEGVMSELYGVTGWDFDFRDYKFYGDWQAALGVAMRVPHLSWASMEGEAKRDFPASIFFQSPWYKEFSYIEDHFSRINTLMSRGKPKVRVAVIHPIESYWISLGPSKQTLREREQLDEDFRNITEWLLFGGISFDYICEALLPKQCSAGGYPLKVGYMEYEAVLVPNCITLRKTTVERLEQFRQRGGKLIFAGKRPLWMDGGPSVRLEKLYYQSNRLPFEKSSILKALNKYADIEIYDEKGNPSQHFLYQLREEEERKWIFLARGKVPYHKDQCSWERIHVRIRGEGSVVLWDTLTGNSFQIDNKQENGWTKIFLKLYEYDSVLLSLENGPIFNLQSLLKPSYKKRKELNIPQNVKIFREEPNVLLLDKGEYALDNEEYSAKTEILRADNVCRERLGWDLRGMAIVQPWVQPKEKCRHKLKLRFQVQSKTELDEVLLGLEKVSEKQIVWNGKKLIPEITGWYTDKAIETVRIPRVKEGNNYLEIVQPFGKHTNTEWIYLLGEFSVELRGERAILSKWEPEIGFDNLVIQGMPFYGGAVTYEVPFETTKENITIQIPHYRAGLLMVWVDGLLPVPLVLPPYQVNLNNLKPGRHLLKVKAYISRNNSFGPVHLADEKDMWVGPSAWRTTGDRWTESYRLKPQGLLSKISILEYS